ncbi:MAG TPA: nitroreductase family protein [Pyrinomonadaceae bacterium]|nr:nitroreductase family protein [Pyrinomonadaceae bacterium]
MKHANAEHPVDDLLRRRWSPLAFSARSVGPETLLSLFEAARWAPSSFNGQPWRFVVATKDEPEEFNRMLGCLVPANQRWAKDAPVLMLAVASLNFAHDGRPNRHAMYDTGAAVMCMILQATSLGLYAHQMGGFIPERARETYSIPGGFEPAAAVALGYLGDPESLPEDLRARERKPPVRQPLRDFVFAGRWAAPAPWLTPADGR